MWKENWKQFLDDLKNIPSKVDSNVIAKPTTNEKIAEIEQKFGIELPPKFKDFLMTSASGINIWWDFEDGTLVKLEGERESISGGYFNMSLNEILEMNFRIEEDYRPHEDDLKIQPRNLLAFASVENGDQFAVVHSGDGIDSIKYISHDLDDIHLYRVGEDIHSFLSHYARIGFAGCEYWIWEQFTRRHTTPIDSESPKAVEFLNAIKCGIRSAEAEEMSNRMELARRLALLKMSANKASEKKEYIEMIEYLKSYDGAIPEKARDILDNAKERVDINDALIKIGFVNNTEKGRKRGWWLGKRYYGSVVKKVYEEYTANLERGIPVDNVDKPKCSFCENLKADNQSTCGNKECIEKQRKLKFKSF